LMPVPGAIPFVVELVLRISFFVFLFLTSSLELAVIFSGVFMWDFGCTT
jgi:hypothetical protein